MTASDLVPGGEAAARMVCEGLNVDRGKAAQCVRAMISNFVIGGLCSRARVDGGASLCGSLVRVSGDSLVLETTDAVYLVVDGAKSL